ncbi:hypothetical protein HY792_01960 [Candidatus Desantisbacteria bacterium]|nr:hypothetical protein [Candidatus Desantisbacteria bacterium]
MLKKQYSFTAGNWTMAEESFGQPQGVAPTEIHQHIHQCNHLRQEFRQQEC